jgi:hypothetical protein
MDLLPAMRMVWRHRLATAGVVLATIVGAIFVLAVQHPVYEAYSSFVLISPPNPPSEAQIKADPSLRTARTDNPYTRFDTQWVMVDLLAQAVTTDAAREALVRTGADGRYRVAPSSKFGFSSAIVQVTALGSSERSAITTATLVSKAVRGELRRMQAVLGVDSRYMIRPLQLEKPQKAVRRPSGQLRMVFGVLAAGALLLVLLLSVLDTISRWRVERSRDAAPSAASAPPDDAAGGAEPEVTARPRAPPGVLGVARSGPAGSAGDVFDGVAK